MGDLIYCQRDIPKHILRYGFRSSAATGCGWIATYNALTLLGLRAEPEELIRYYERRLPLIHGNLGTTILAPAFFFRRHGFRVEYTADKSRFDTLAKSAQVCILFYRWRRGLKMGTHFVALTGRDGCFTGYNTYANSRGPDLYGPSLEAFLRQKHYFAPVLIAIGTK